MYSQLRERIRLMRARLDNAAPVAEIRAESQLFVTPAPVCDRLVTLAGISNRDHILEPSAGTGAILRAIRDTAPVAMCDAVEINSGLVRYLRENFNGVRVQCGDFMEWQPVQYYSRVIMNPPFSHGQDIPAQFLHRVQHPRRSDPRVWSHVTQPAGHAGERHRFSHA